MQILSQSQRLGCSSIVRDDPLTRFRIAFSLRFVLPEKLGYGKVAGKVFHFPGLSQAGRNITTFFPVLAAVFRSNPSEFHPESLDFSE